MKPSGMKADESGHYASVWDAIAESPEQAATLRARAELMRGRVSRFSIDALVNLATAIGRRVYIDLQMA